MMKISNSAWALGFLALCAVTTTSCVTAQGQPSRGKIPATIEIRPETNNRTNRLNTQHTFVVRVTDTQGRPVPEARVEWILQRHLCQVGDIVDVGGTCSPCVRSKRDNTYAVGETARKPVTLADGTQINVGEAWLVVTSSFPGDTNVIAYAPGIKDWQKHKVFGIKHWGPDYDFGCDTSPGCAPSGTGTATVWVQKDGGSASSYRVDFVGEGVTVSPASCNIGPMTPGSMERGSCNVSVSANSAGSYRISYTISPMGGAAGDDKCCCPGAVEPMHDGSCTVDFGAGALACSVNPVQSSLCPGDPASFQVTITNTGSCVVNNATATANWSGCCGCPSTPISVGSLQPGQSVQQTITCNDTANCTQGQTCSVSVTVSGEGGAGSSCQASVGFGNPNLVCSLSALQGSLCPGDDANFRLCIRNTGNCNSGGVSPTITVTHNGAPIQISPVGDCSWPAMIPGGGEMCCTLTIPASQLPQSGRLCVNAQVPGTSANCDACVELGTISVVCDKRLTNGDAQGRVELGDTANFAVTITNTSSCPVTLQSFSDAPTCGSANDSDCQRYVGQSIQPRATVNCTVTVDTTSCEAGSFENVVNVTVGAGSATAQTSCRAPFATFVIPAMECSFVDTIDPVYVGGTPDDANRSSTTNLDWTFVNQRFTVEGVSFRWEIPANLELRNGASAASVDMTGAGDYFRASDLRFSNTSHDGINFQVIEILSAKPIEQGGQGVITIQVKARNAGIATTLGFWQFKGYNTWVREDTGTTVRP